MALGMSNEDYIPEEGYDIARDMGKIPPTKDKKDATTMPRSYQPQKPTGGKSALDIVKADIRKKYGKDAIMDVGKKIMPALSKKQQKFFELFVRFRKVNKLQQLLRLQRQQI